MTSLKTNEARRLKVLWQYDVLDTVPEEVFDDLTELAARICEAPIALISLIDEDRQWFKAKVGVTLNETSRDISFCSHAIKQQDLFIIPDATLDARFADNPVVVDRNQNTRIAGEKITMLRGQQKVEVEKPILTAPPIKDLGADKAPAAKQP